MKKVMLIYPNGELYQRGEERCQINTKASVANSMRACNDLGIIAAILKNASYNVFLKDYQSEKKNIQDLKNDLIKENPEVLFISITNGSIFEDLKTVKLLKNLKKDMVIILKGALFFNPDENLFTELDLQYIDYLIGSETEFIIKPLLDAHFTDKNLLNNIEGICFKKNNKWKINPIVHFNEDLDKIPFPDRSLMNNSLYVNPLTNKPMATISISKGCPSSCIYCLSPVISGKKVRFRSCENILEEIKQCVFTHNIKDFFFKADNFTADKIKVIELCDLIIKSQLKINWCANSRVNTIDKEMLAKMKQAGCSLIALGIESGSQESLDKMKKGAVIKQCTNTVHLIKQFDIKIFGFYLIGFPWENKNHLNETKKLIFSLDTDFIEISIVVPFKGTMLYNTVYKNSLNGKNVLGKDSFNNINYGTNYLSKKQLENFKKNVILSYHLRPSFIFKKLINKNLTFPLLINYVKYGYRLIKNLFIFYCFSNAVLGIAQIGHL